PAHAAACAWRSGLWRGVLGARGVAGGQRIVDMGGRAVDRGDVRQAAALLNGMVPVAGSSRRPTVFAAAPAAWPRLREQASTKAVADKLLNTLVWPGKEGVTVATEAPPLTEAQQSLFELGSTLYAAVCASCHQVDEIGRA